MSLTFIQRARAKQRKTSLIELLDARLSGYEEARSHRVLHASMLTDEEFCPRQFALLYITHKKRPNRYIPSALRVSFDNGVALHDLARNEWLADVAVGDWDCLCGAKKFFCKRPRNCGCGKPRWRYRECEMVCPDTGLVGSVDLFVDFGLGRLVACEVKSLARDDFDTLVAPFHNHRARSILYLHLARSAPFADYVDLSHGRILYISKGFGKKHVEFKKVLPFKEFVVEYVPETIKPHLAMAHTLSRFKKAGVMPIGVCNNSLCKLAQKCPVAHECFSAYPAGSIYNAE